MLSSTVISSRELVISQSSSKMHYVYIQNSNELTEQPKLTLDIKSVKDFELMSIYFDDNLGTNISIVIKERNSSSTSSTLNNEDFIIT